MFLAKNDGFLMGEVILKIEYNGVHFKIAILVIGYLWTGSVAQE